jgi:transcriptional regulator with PAS, ATPase and Fis domain
MFGHRRGAFTGAVETRGGYVEAAAGGTIFLDEIGDMPLSIQAKILRLLQEKSIERLGGREPIPVDVRIIAATNRDLEAAIAEGHFREDLYYRLKVVTLWLPPLRGRSEDIDLLTEYFLKRLSSEMKMDNPGITPEAQTLLRGYPWPGNVRELANTLQKGLIFSRGTPIGAEDLTRVMEEGSEIRNVDEESVSEALRQLFRQKLAKNHGEGLFDSMMDDTAAILISEALNLTGGNRSRAAKLLGLSRPTLQAKIEKYQLKIQTSVSSSS